MDFTDLQGTLAAALFFDHRRKQRQLLGAERPPEPLFGAGTASLPVQFRERETLTLLTTAPSELKRPESTLRALPGVRPSRTGGWKACLGTLWITGAGSGLGMEAALTLAERGYHVFGSVLTHAEADDLKTAALERRVSVEILYADVTRPEEIEAAVQHILAEAGTIDGLIQFAGMGLRGFFEDLTQDEIREVFDVNLFGMMAVTRAVLPIMREARSGRIILTSSVGGRMGSMSIGGYASSKFAVEGFGECLRQEMAPFNVHVSLLEPGMILTPHFTVNRNLARRATDPASPYYAWFRRHESIVDGFLARNTFGPPEVANTVFRILQSRRPRLRYLVGGKAKLITNLRRYLPGEWFERIYWKVVQRMVTRGS